MIAAQQRNGMCAGIGYKVLRLINEKYPDLNSAHVFVQGVLKGYDHWVPGTLVAAEQFVRAFELRLPNKAYVTQTIKTIVDTVIKTDTFRGDASPSNGRGRGAASAICKRRESERRVVLVLPLLLGRPRPREGDTKAKAKREHERGKPCCSVPNFDGKCFQFFFLLLLVT